MGAKTRNKIVILCEGETEVNAVKHFLKPQLDKDHRSVGLKTLITLNDPEKVIDYARGELKKNILGVVTLLDIYGFHCPDTVVTDDIGTSIKKARNYIIKTSGINDTRFHVHFAVHETEAWFFADNDALMNFFGTKDSIVKKEKPPEKINFQNHPSKRINELCIKHKNKSRYRKKSDSLRIFQNLDFDRVLEKCPYFKKFWEDILSLCPK